MTDLHDDVEVRQRGELIPYSNNPKEHPDEQVKKIASSIKNYGWDQPIVVDGDDEIIKGHGRLQAAEMLGLDDVPVIVRDDLTNAEAKASRIADNKTAESDWKTDELATELEVLDDFDATELGFGDDELDEFFEDLQDSEVDELDAEPLADKDLADWKILNLYAGIGGNRKLWGDEPDVTAVEYNETIAEAYGDFYPDDTVVVDDAHEYLLEHFDEFDFIWTSPPCPTHSKMRKNLSMNVEDSADPVFPDMDLYEEILLLQGYFDGHWCVENVEPWYDPLIEPKASGRHMFWSNFNIPDIDVGSTIGGKLDNYDTAELATRLGYDIDEIQQYNFPSEYPVGKVVRNCVHPEVGKAILQSAVEDTSGGD